MLGRLVRRLRSDLGVGGARAVAELLASSIGETASPVVGVHRQPMRGIRAAVEAVLPGAEVVELPVDSTERHLLMARCGPFDAVVDVAGRRGEEGRRRRFEETFWHLAAGRPYVVPGGAREVGGADGLGPVLADVASGPGEPLRATRRKPREYIRLALRNHVRRRVAGDHLVLTHDLPDVLVKVREEDYDAFLATGGGPRHRVLDVLPAEEPPTAPRFREGPNRRPRPMDRPIGSAVLSLRDYRDVVVSAPQVVVDGRVLLPDTFRHNRSPVLGHKALADVAPRFAVPRAPIGSDLPRLSGTFVHLDNESRGHFGHVLTETLSRIWTWEKALRIDPEARAIMGATVQRPELAEWELEFYAVCGIPRERIVLLEIDRPMRVERLISGTPMWSQPHYVHPRIRQTWRRVGDQLAAAAPAGVDWPRRIFISRRISRRACVNGEQLEAEFAAAGFEIVYPEDYSLGHQVALFRHADVIAGYGGSGMFQTLFVDEPKHVIQVASEAYGPRNEYLIAAVLGHRLDSIICRAEPYDGLKAMLAPFRYDPDREGPFLREILASLPALGSGA